MDQSDAEHHRRLRPKIDGLASDIYVAVVQRLEDLGKRKAVRASFAWSITTA